VISRVVGENIAVLGQKVPDYAPKGFNLEHNWLFFAPFLSAFWGCVVCNLFVVNVSVGLGSVFHRGGWGGSKAGSRVLGLGSRGLGTRLGGSGGDESILRRAGQIMCKRPEG